MPDDVTNWSVNPIALAELILGTRLTPGSASNESAALSRVQDLLEKAHRTNLEAIFETEGNKPARLDLFQRLADSARSVSVGSLHEPQELARILQLQQVQELIRDYGYAEEAIRRVLPY